MVLASPAVAQEPTAEAARRPPAPEGVSITIGVATILSPAWQGSRDSSLSLFPDLRISYGDLLFASVPEGIGLNAVNQNGLRAGPLAKLRFGRDEKDGGSPFLISGGSNALAGMGNVKAAVEAGGFVEQGFGPRTAWRIRGEVRRGFGGHEGVLVDASLSYRASVGRVRASIGPRATWASRDFMQTYYGIDAGQSLRTGLTRYNANSGILSYGLGGTLIRPLDRRSALTMFTSLERLGDQAADSPLVRDRGQPTQFTVGLGYGFRFGL